MPGEDVIEEERPELLARGRALRRIQSRRDRDLAPHDAPSSVNDKRGAAGELATATNCDV